MSDALYFPDSPKTSRGRQGGHPSQEPPGFSMSRITCFHCGLLYRCCFPPTRRFLSPHFRPLLPVPGPCGITRRRQGPPRTGSRMRKHQRLGKASAAACLPPEPNTCKSRMQCQIQFMQCQIQVFPAQFVLLHHEYIAQQL